MKIPLNILSSSSDSEIMFRIDTQVKCQIISLMDSLWTNLVGTTIIPARFSFVVPGLKY